MNRQELLTDLAKNLPKWPQKSTHLPLFRGFVWIVNTGGWELKEARRKSAVPITRADYLAERKRLINKPSPDALNPQENWLAQDPCGDWMATTYELVTLDPTGENWMGICSAPSDAWRRVCSGAIPAGHRWQDTLERVEQPWQPGIDLPPIGTVCELEEPHDADDGRPGYVGPVIPGAAGKQVEICAHFDVPGWHCTLAAYASVDRKFGGVGAPIAFRKASPVRETVGKAPVDDNTCTPEDKEMWQAMEAMKAAMNATMNAKAAEAAKIAQHFEAQPASSPSWDDFYLSMAQLAAGKSKDPSTGVGAVIVRPDRTVVSLGFNGFPRGAVDDTQRMAADRDWKLSRTIHAEINAILTAREPLNGCTLYVWPIPPCSHCAAVVAQSGIKLVVAPAPSDRWLESCNAGRDLLEECGVVSNWHWKD